MNDKALSLPEQLAWREIQQGTYHADLWQKALAEARGNQVLAREAYIRLRTASIQGGIGQLMARQIRSAVAEDDKRPPDFKSHRDLGRS
jgi:hypothetical protein